MLSCRGRALSRCRWGFVLRGSLDYSGRDCPWFRCVLLSPAIAPQRLSLNFKIFWSTRSDKVLFPSLSLTIHFSGGSFSFFISPV